MPPKPLPLRTALIGLSSSAATSWAANAHLPALLSASGLERYKITALLNSSEQAAKSAIKTYKLPAETKAYGTPADLAGDPDIDVVICNTRVDSHYETIIPSVRAGKDVFVEWPIAGKQEHIREIVEAAGKSGSRVAVGLQRRWAPPVLKVGELIDGGKGKLGKVLSSEVRIFGGSRDREILPNGLRYFTKREIGGNVIVIGVGHVLDSVLSVVGDIDPASVQAKTQIQRPSVRIRDPATNEIIDKVVSDVPDLLSLNGTISAPQAAPDATLSLLFRRGQPFPNTPALTWTVNCEFGEIRLVSPSSTSFETDGLDDPVTIHVHTFDDDAVTPVEWTWSDIQKDLPLPARNVLTVLTAFANQQGEGEGWVSLEDAARRADLIQGFFESE